ncbi:MAG: hypothetical protein IIZ18_02310, partial [Ruminococcus sp.]|nr:hypothetical protein [Ruminococcus sp.]
GKRFQRGKTKGKKGEEMPIFVGFNLFLPLFPLGLSPLGTSWRLIINKKSNVRLKSFQKVNAVAVSDVILSLDKRDFLCYTVYSVYIQFGGIYGYHIKKLV